MDAEWRFFRGWKKHEIEDRLNKLSRLERNFTYKEEPHWNLYHSDCVVGRDSLVVLKPAIVAYEFSDPRIVRAHFDPATPLLGRRMLLEIQVLGFHFLCGTVVSEVVDESSETENAFGFRYDTLEGHLESGMEWFVLRHNKLTDETRFRIDARWRAGEFPNWWSKLGFYFLVRAYQKKWHRLAHARLKRIGAKAMNKKNIWKQELLQAGAMGVLAGLRSFSAPVTALHGKNSRLKRPFEILAIFEMMADKLPSIPSRIEPIPLAARGISGALSAVAASTANFPKTGFAKRRGVLALVGGTVAIASAYGGYHLRKTLGEKLGIKDNVLGLLEDAAVLKTRSAIIRRTLFHPNPWL